MGGMRLSNSWDCIEMSFDREKLVWIFMSQSIPNEDLENLRNTRNVLSTEA